MPGIHYTTFAQIIALIYCGKQHKSWSADVLKSLAPKKKKPHLPEALVILKTLIILFRCFSLVLEAKLCREAALYTRTNVANLCFRLLFYPVRGYQTCSIFLADIRRL